MATDSWGILLAGKILQDRALPVDAWSGVYISAPGISDSPDLHTQGQICHMAHAGG